MGDIKSSVSDIRNEVSNKISEKIKPTEDKINNIDGSIQDVSKTLAVFEGRHVETVEKIKEVAVTTNNIQVQIKAQVRDIMGQAGLSGQKIEELDTITEKLEK